MNGHTVANSGGVVYLPSASDWTTVDNSTGARFRVIIAQIPNTYTIVVTTTGCGSDSTICRGIQLQYTQTQLFASIFNYGVATKGSLQSSNTLTVNGPAGDMSRGGVLIATANSAPLKNTGTGSGFSGDLWYTNGAGTNKYTGLTLDGLAPTDPGFAAHVHAGATAPTFPSVDGSVFQPYVNRTYPNTSGGANQTLVNTALAPGNYNFSGTTVIQGVLYIQTPNTISFSGPVTIQGAIVVEPNPQGTSATNSLSFTNTVSALPMDSLTSSVEFPAAERALTGSVILAPNFSVVATNTFGTVCGSMIAGKFTFTNAFTATFNGSLIQLDDTPMTFSNTGNITINPLPSPYLPAGVTVGTNYVPSQASYVEVVPK